MSLSFLIGAAQFLAVFLWLGFLVLAVSAVWTLVCWIAGHQQRCSDRRAANRRDRLETAAIRQLGDLLHSHPHDAIDSELDQHLDQYADSIQALYPTGEQQ